MLPHTYTHTHKHIVNILSAISMSMQVVSCRLLNTNTHRQMHSVCSSRHVDKETHTHTHIQSPPRLHTQVIGCLPVITAVGQLCGHNRLLVPSRSPIGRKQRGQLSLSQSLTALCLCEKLSSSFA